LQTEDCHNIIVVVLRHHCINKGDAVTDPQKTGFNLINSQLELFEPLVEAANAAICCFNTLGQILTINHLFTEFFGDKIGPEQNITSILNEDTGFKNNLLEEIIQNKTIEKEISTKNKNGKSIYLRIMCGPLRSDQIVIGGYAVCINITKTREQQTKIRERDNRLRALVNVTRDGIAIIDQNHKVLEANKQFCDMLGYNPEEVVTLHTWDWEAIYSEEQIRKAYADLSHIRQIIETKHKRKDGSVFDVEVSMTGTVVSGQNVVITVCRDVSERKEAEEALKQSEAKFRSFVENASDLIFTLDKSGTVTYVSPNAKRLTGYTREEVEGKLLIDYLHEDDHETYISFINKAFENQAIETPLEYRLRYKNGKFTWNALNGNIDLSNRDNPVLIGISRNIAERKKYEEKLHYLSQHDQLTGLYNRNPFEYAMQQLEENPEYPLSFISCDLNNLKAINDTYGHPQGDELLKATAEVLKKSLRDEDIIARLGGDEFAIILKKSDENTCNEIISRIKHNIEYHNNFCKTSEKINLAIGAYTADDNTISLKDAFKIADDNMYVEKGKLK